MCNFPGICCFRPVEESSSSSEATDSEEYGEERDQFTAQLYKFHEERGTPINRAPILGGKDIDMFRLYNVVQAYGGKKRVTVNNKWKKVLSKLRLEGCPGATPITVKNAYSRYLDHFNSFYRSLGLSNWPTTSTSSRSMRQIRLGGRESAQWKNSLQLRRKRLLLMAERKKEKEKEKEQKEKESEFKEKELKSVKEREEKLKKDKASKEEGKEKAKEKAKKDDKETKKERESAVSQGPAALKTGLNERRLSETAKKDEKEKMEERQKEKEKTKGKEKNREKDIVKEKEKGKEKIKEKEQAKDKEKEKQKGKEKGRPKEKEKDKDKRKEAEKPTEKEKDKPKEKAKIKEKEKDSAALKKGASVENDQASEKDKGGSFVEAKKPQKETDVRAVPEEAFNASF